MVSANFAAALNDVAVMQYNGTYYAPINVTAVNSGLFGLSSSGVMGFRTTLTGMVSISSTSFVGALTGNATTATNIAVGGITGLGTGVATALAVNVGTAGSVVVNGGALGTPSSGTLTNATGLLVAGITGLGTGVATALAVNVGSAGAFVVFNGALGTPSSGVGTNLTALTAANITASTTVGRALLNLTNPGAITFTRINADNSVDALSASAFRTAIGAGTGDVVGPGSATDGAWALYDGTTGKLLKNGVVPSATAVGLGSVTNDAQTKAAIVPNTTPSAGQLLVGNAGGTAYAAVSSVEM